LYAEFHAHSKIIAAIKKCVASCTNLRLVCVRLNADEQIQMVTALALQLIQCVVKLPSHISTEQYQSHDLDDVGSAKKKNDFVCPVLCLLDITMGLCIGTV